MESIGHSGLKGENSTTLPATQQSVHHPSAAIQKAFSLSDGQLINPARYHIMGDIKLGTAITSLKVQKVLGLTAVAVYARGLIERVAVGIRNDRGEPMGGSVFQPQLSGIVIAVKTMVLGISHTDLRNSGSWRNRAWSRGWSSIHREPPTLVRSLVTQIVYFQCPVTRQLFLQARDSTFVDKVTGYVGIRQNRRTAYKLGRVAGINSPAPTRHSVWDLLSLEYSSLLT